ncbi:MAG: hypoxanthine phosphoribosyltransferase, partial [Clostridia bacterium]|nr:hypoxanthine phosphoribosyltransferase [Clostridia bacterium]
MIKDVEKILLSEEKIEQTVQSLADKISADYAGKKLLLLGILKGSVVFMGDLMKHLTIPVQIDFMRVSSYGHGTVSSGRVNIILDLFRNDIGECD